MIFDHCSKQYYWSVKWYYEPPFKWCLPIRQEILNVSQIAVTLHGIRIHCPDFTATAPQMSLLSLYALLFLQSHLFLICVVLTYNDSRIIPRKTFQIPRNCQCKWLLVSSLAPGTSFGSYWFAERILFCTGRTVTTELPNLVPPRCIDDCYAIHFLHWEFCDPQLSSHPNFPLGARLYQHVFCKKPSLFSSSSRFRNLDRSESRKVREHTVLTRTRFHFCSRPHW